MYLTRPINILNNLSACFYSGKIINITGTILIKKQMGGAAFLTSSNNLDKKAGRLKNNIKTETSVMTNWLDQIKIYNIYIAPKIQPFVGVDKHSKEIL